MDVRKVTVLEDRAWVRRQGRVELSAGLTTLEIEGVAPVLVDKTLRAHLSDPRARLVDAQLERIEVSVGDASDDSLRGELERLEVDIAERQRAVDAHRKVLASLEQLSRQTHLELGEDAAWAAFEPEAALSALDRLAARRAEAEEEIASRVEGLQKQREARERLAVRMTLEAMPPEPEPRTVLRVTLDASEALSTELSLEYIVPCACWRPVHLAELKGEATAPELRLRTEACVWQNTGEDWTDVELELSTERRSLGATPPALSDDFLRTRPKDEAVVVQARDEAVEDAGLGTGSRGTRRVEEVPGIEDGGLARQLSVSGRGHVPSDGRPVRFALTESGAPVQLSRRVAAELSSRVILATVQDNTGGQPLLPGPVELLRQGGLVGRTRIPFVADGETFELGWGPDPELRVSRRQERTEERAPTLGRWTKETHEVEVLLSNIGADTKTVEVIERIPVSELEQVRIHPLPQKTEPAAAPDRDGFVRWTIELPPFGRARVKLAYLLEHHATVVGMS